MNLGKIIVFSIRGSIALSIESESEKKVICIMIFISIMMICLYVFESEANPRMTTVVREYMNIMTIIIIYGSIYVNDEMGWHEMSLITVDLPFLAIMTTLRQMTLSSMLQLLIYMIHDINVMMENERKLRKI